jgi:ABC-type sugar transport system permease subunit
MSDLSVVRRPSSVVSYDTRTAWLFLSPVMAVLGAVTVFPIFYSLYISFFSLKLTRPQRVPFVGIDNYLQVAQDEIFWDAVARTAWFTVVSVTAVTLIALLIALLLDQSFRGRRLLGALLLVPWAIPSVANGLMWKWIYDSHYGALNGLLLQLGAIAHYLPWLGDPHKTLLLIANAFVWKEVPLAAILILVTMKAIPADLYKAATVDGANRLQRFLHITLPSLRPGLMLVVVYVAMVAIRQFDLIFLLTEGGPAQASQVMAWQIYVETFRNLSFGTGAALSYILAIATFALAYFIIRAMGQRL